MSFITDHFLLENAFAERLYHEYAADLPILDYHNHLDPEQVATDHRFENLSQAWLEGDHYKWRAMRTLGVPEAFITGNAPDREKFRKWAACVPQTIRNPLFHWTHLELLRYFDWDGMLNADHADEVYALASDKLAGAGFGAQGLLQQMKVEVVCTTDDPADSLQWHEKARADGIAPRMLPAFRPDLAYTPAPPETYNAYLDRLEAASGVQIKTYSDLLQALEMRMDAFQALGCRLSDHGLEHLPMPGPDATNPEAVFLKLRQGGRVSPEAWESLQYGLLLELCRSYHRRGWVQQFHLGALRNASSRLLDQLGPNTGFDSIGDFSQARRLAAFLDTLDQSDQLTKTVLYTLNPAWNEVFATMAGNFNDGSSRGKVQFGSGWWFNDQLDGMRQQMEALSQMGLISTFVGMLTDSRSLLSFPRHEYFRRLVCQLFGEDIQRGLLPTDLDHIGGIVQDICYGNALSYFEFKDHISP
ncbi:glucuronate isomerase [Robiginitalea sp. M366]|uniref:glucuronate isomerase n=1 Tax=Robiginitalea aestuariiviva TaxID=3036903 RepID=UPI00240E7294|nr:glucuronate isomerase [Robiginitalea aestuariiviva]MDG1571089.1 glucuronate isomerase [Robiginitalea aestuariiviva]